MPLKGSPVNLDISRKMTRASARMLAKLQDDLEKRIEDKDSLCSKYKTEEVIKLKSTDKSKSTKKESHTRKHDMKTQTKREIQISHLRNKHQDKIVVSEESQSKPTTPRKERSTTTELELCSSVTPPKVRRKDVENVLKSPPTPSSIFKKLTLSSPTKPVHSDDFEPKKLFEEHTVYQNAKRALHSTLPVQMPGREKELNEMRDFIKYHLHNNKSGTLYVSGPPGTGKTASLSSILCESDVTSNCKHVYVNCTAIKSSGSIYSRILKELNVKISGKSEKDYLNAIEKHLSKNHKMILLVLDEIDQLDSKKQSVLYTIFEWPAKPDWGIILIGIANALDLTDRILPRLQVRCELKPKLMHFAPYTKQQIVQIFTERLKQAGVLDVFSPVALQMLAGKVAAVSGDVRRALDIGRRVIELVEQNKNEVLRSLENFDDTPKPVDLKQVISVLNNVYGTTNNLSDDNSNDNFPLQQKIILCTLLLILKKARNKDVTIGKLHEVYRKVCMKRNLMAVDQSEFVGLCSLIETRGIIRVSGRKEIRLHKVTLEWDQDEVSAALKDKQLMSTILQDDGCLGKM